MNDQLSRFMNIMMELVRIYQPTMREDLLVEKAIKASAAVQQDTSAIQTMIRRQAALTESIDRDIHATRELLAVNSDERIQARAQQVCETLESCRAYILAYRAACEQVLATGDEASMNAIFADCDEARARYQTSFRQFQGRGEDSDTAE